MLVPGSSPSASLRLRLRAAGHAPDPGSERFQPRARLPAALKLVERPADGLAGGIGAVVFLGDPLGFPGNAAGGLERLFPCLWIGRGLLDDIADDLAQID